MYDLGQIEGIEEIPNYEIARLEAIDFENYLSTGYYKSFNREVIPVDIDNDIEYINSFDTEIDIFGFTHNEALTENKIA